jgi:hypothetical protein
MLQNPVSGLNSEPPEPGQHHATIFLEGRFYVGVLISLGLFLFPIFLFAAQPKEFVLDGLKKLEQRSHKCVELRGNM